MKSVTRNLIANYVGRGWALIINLVATPLLIKALGIESYGLIGFYTTLYGVINLVDFGISPTINRELAKYSVDGTQTNRGRDLVRTLEIGYWIIGVLLGIIVYFGAPIIAQKWLQTSKLSIETLTQSIRLMGFLVVLEWPFTFYQGALLGMQKHILLNTINIMNSLFKFGGGLLVLTFISPTIDAFFTWQIMVSTIVITLQVISVWRCLPASEVKPAFDKLLFGKIWKFALSMNLISFLGLIIHQMDKVMVSHFFTLDIFGYYNLATIITNGFTILVSPIYLTFFPRLSTLVAQNDHKTLTRVYHESCQLVSVAILPAITTGILFIYKIIEVWTGNPDVAEKSSPIAAILLIGTAINALESIPYHTQVAHGWTKLALYTNIISLPLVLGLIFVLNIWFGIQGIAAVWVIYCLLVLVITMPIMHKNILKGEYGIWLKQDVLVPVLVCIVYYCCVLFLDSIGFHLRNSLLFLFCFAIIIEVSVAMSVPFTRMKIFYYFKKWKLIYENGFAKKI